MHKDRLNQQFLLAARPNGEIQPTDFELQDVPLPVPGDDEVLVEVHYLAVEPAMKGWMEARVDYVAPLQIGDVMRGGGVGVVVQSNRAEFPEGTLVSGPFGWRRYFVSDGTSVPLRAVPEGISATAALNVLGITGLTAYFGMLDLGKPQAGQTVVVSGAAGATGSIAGQLARIAGARVIGIAGGKAKCDWLTSELSFDGAIDYKSEDTAARVRELCPDGLDVFYDNVGGEILDLCLDRLAHHARVVICGGISRYNEEGELPGPKNYFNLIFFCARMQGFLAHDYADRFDEFYPQMEEWVRSGAVKQRETVVEGFENLPKALVALFEGANTGKMMVHVS